MIKKLFYVITLALIFGVTYADEPRVVKYKMENNQFTIIVVQENNLSYDDAKNIAMKKAAETTKDNNFKYFELKAEDEVTIMLGKSNFPSSYDFPQNLYQEEIVEKGFDRERFIEQGVQDNQPYPAVRIIIQCLNTKTKNALNPCDYMNCSK
jgi:hypothetical protein